MTGEQVYEVTRQIAIDMGIKLPMFYELEVSEQIKWDELAAEQLSTKGLISTPESGRLQP